MKTKIFGICLILAAILTSFSMFKAVNKQEVDYIIKSNNVKRVNIKELKNKLDKMESEIKITEEEIVKIKKDNEHNKENVAIITRNANMEKVNIEVLKNAESISTDKLRNIRIDYEEEQKKNGVLINEIGVLSQEVSFMEREYNEMSNFIKNFPEFKAQKIAEVKKESEKREEINKSYALKGGEPINYSEIQDDDDNYFKTLDFKAFKTNKDYLSANTLAIYSNFGALKLRNNEISSLIKRERLEKYLNKSEIISAFEIRSNYSNKNSTLMYIFDTTKGYLYLTEKGDLFKAEDVYINMRSPKYRAARKDFMYLESTVSVINKVMEDYPNKSKVFSDERYGTTKYKGFVMLSNANRNSNFVVSENQSYLLINAILLN